MGDKYTIARFTKDNEHFEVLVKPEKALDYRMGKISAITEVLVTDTTFADANKGRFFLGSMDIMGGDETSTEQ